MNHRAFTVNPGGGVISGIHVAGSKGNRHIDLRGVSVPLDHRNPPVTTNSTLTRGAVVTVVKHGRKHRQCAGRIVVKSPKGDARRATLVLLRSRLGTMKITGTVYSIAVGQYALLEVHEHAMVVICVEGGRCLELTLPSLDKGITCRML